MNERQILELVQNVMGAPALHVARMTDGAQNEVWNVTLTERELIVRLHPDPRRFAATEHNLEVLASLGLPVPTVLAADLTLTRLPFAWLILTKLPGRDLRHELAGMTELQMTRLAEQIASCQTAVGALSPGTGYGYVGIGGHGLYASWWEVMLAQSWWHVKWEGPVSQAVSGDSDTVGHWQARVCSLIFQHEAYLRSVPPTCFLDDITVKNVLVEGGELQGLVDFDCVCYGDPLYWLGLTAVGVVSDVGMRKLFYVRELCRFLHLSDDQHRVFLLYAAWIGLGFVDRFAAGETQEWSLRMLHAVEDWVLDLEGRTARASLPSI